MAISTIAKTRSGQRRRPRNAPSLMATGSRTAAASASRDQATKPGDISSTAILMNRYGMPQTTETAANSVQPRGLTRPPSGTPP